MCRSSQPVVGGFYVELERTPEAVAVSVGTQGVRGWRLSMRPLPPGTFLDKLRGLGQSPRTGEVPVVMAKKKPGVVTPGGGAKVQRLSVSLACSG